MRRRRFLRRAAAWLARPDDSLANRIESLSEPETGPFADNLMTNEDSVGRVASEVAHRAPRGSFYVGVGPDQNLSLAAHARPELAIVVDFRRRNLLVHLMHKALLTLSADRAGYLSRLTAREPARPLSADSTAREIVAAFGPATFDQARLTRAIAEVADLLRPLGVVREAEFAAVATIQAKLAGPGLEARFLALRMYPTLAKLIAVDARDGAPAHFLASEPLYRAIRGLERADGVVPVVGDFGGAAALRRLADWLRGRERKVGVFYISDVEFFLIRSGRFAVYAAGLAALPWAEGAIVVRTSTREIEHAERIKGDSSTTIVRSAARFVADAAAGRIKTVDDLFRPA